MKHFSPIHEPLTIFLLGATGDLAKKKILRAIYALYVQDLLPADFTLIGNARSKLSEIEFRDYVRSTVEPVDVAEWAGFAESLFYVAGDTAQPETFVVLKEFYLKLAQQRNCGNHLWYLATLPQLYQPILESLNAGGLHQLSQGWSKILLEKPFGTDLETARSLDSLLKQSFEEKNIYRIDHFLGKETVQNLLVFRFANGLFENLWNRQFVDHIQITAAETIGIEGRATFYDQTGTVRDVIQNHVLQMMAMTLMEEPASLQAQDVRRSRDLLLQQLRPLVPSPETVAFGQYAAGGIDGSTVPGYLSELDIPPESKTETAVAFTAFVDNPTWQDVPIFVRAGKRLARNVTEITLVFKEPANQMFAAEGLAQRGTSLTLRIQPNEGIVVRLKVKEPGLKLKVSEAPMQFCYASEFQMGLVEAYVKLLHDAVEGEPGLFPQASEIEASWSYVMPLITYREQAAFSPEFYQAGSWGPSSFEQLLKPFDRTWIEPSIDVCPLPSKAVSTREVML